MNNEEILLFCKQRQREQHETNKKRHQLLMTLIESLIELELQIAENLLF
jgi:hypothetical protein